MVHTDFGHIPWVIADRDIFPHIGGQRGIDIAQGLEPQPILMHAAGLGDCQEQQVQVLQGYGELGEKAVGAPTSLWRYAGGTVGRLMILMQYKVFEGLREALQALAEGAQLATQQLWGTAAPTRPRTAE